MNGVSGVDGGGVLGDGFVVYERNEEVGWFLFLLVGGVY